MEFIKHVFEPWNGMPVLDSNFVGGPAIHTQPHRAILLGDKKGGTAQGLKLSRTNPLEINSSTWLWTSKVSLGFILYTGLLGKMAPE